METAVKTDIEPRLKNPAGILPDATEGIQSMIKAVYKGGVPRKTLDLVHMRVSQINGCGACLESGARTSKKEGESDERLATVAGWRHVPFFDDAERSALALSETMTRLADSTEEAVPDAIWDDAAQHYNEKQLAALVLWISLTNLFNRVNVSTRQLPGSW